MTEPSNVKKARLKSLDLAKRTTEQRLKEEYALEGAERIKSDIRHLKNTIMNCKDDLAGGFRGNPAILNKLDFAEKQLVAKQEELKGLEKPAE